MIIEQGNRPPTVDDVAATLDRVVDRLRTMAESRLTRHDPAMGLSLAEAAHRLAEAWAAMVHGVDGPAPPRLSPLASGDQLAVVGADMLAAWRTGNLNEGQQRTVATGLDELRRMA